MEHKLAQTSLSLANLTDVQLAILQVVCAFETVPTRKIIAARLSLHYQTVCMAMADPKFKKVYEQICLGISNSRLFEVMEVITDKAITGNTADRKLYCEVHKLIGKHDPPPPPPPQIDDRGALEKKRKEIEERINDLRKNESVPVNHKVENGEKTSSI